MLREGVDSFYLGDGVRYQCDQHDLSVERNKKFW